MAQGMCTWLLTDANLVQTPVETDIYPRDFFPLLHGQTDHFQVEINFLVNFSRPLFSLLTMNRLGKPINRPVRSHKIASGTGIGFKIFHTLVGIYYTLYTCRHFGYTVSTYMYSISLAWDGCVNWVCISFNCFLQTLSQIVCQCSCRYLPRSIFGQSSSGVICSQCSSVVI